MPEQQPSDFVLLDCIDDLVEKSAEAAAVLRQAVSEVHTTSDIGVYWHPEEKLAGVYVRVGNGLVEDLESAAKEAECCLDAISERIGEDSVVRDLLKEAELQDPWVKVAYSPTIRRVAEALQFLPSSKGDFIGGRPLASTLATGVLGAGLGYGSGYLAEKFLPEIIRDKDVDLKKRYAIAGGLGGAALGATPGLLNKMVGRKFNDRTLWNDQSDEPWEDSLVTSRFKSATENYVVKEAYGTIGGPSFQQIPLVKHDALGRVVYNTGLGPQLAQATMGAAYGASQMPDPNSTPNGFTPNQMGLFGMAMGAAGGGAKGYLTGLAVGKTLGLLTGMPAGTQNKLRNTGALAGAIGTVVPRLF